MPDPIVIRGTPILHRKAKELPAKLFGSKELSDILRRMSASLRETAHGVAIAAPQIGLPYRIFVVRGFVMADKERHAEGSDDEGDVAFINPKIIKRSRKRELMEEACLSVPGYAGHIKRSLQAAVRAYDEKGARFERGAAGLLAQIFQHETDHLDGILYVDKAEEVFASKSEHEQGEEETDVKK